MSLLLPFLVLLHTDASRRTSTDTMHYISVYSLAGAPDSEIEMLLDGARGLIVCGGPQHIPSIDAHPELQDSLRLLSAAIRRRMPVLGICLGFQLLNYMYGNAVVTLERPHIGCGYLALESVCTHGLSKLALLDFACLQGSISFHYDGVLENTHPDLCVVARDYCGHVYMIAHRDMPVYGIQSHPEATVESIAACFRLYGIHDACIPEDSASFQSIRYHFFETLLGTGSI